MISAFPPMDLANFINFVSGLVAGGVLAGIAFYLAMKA